MNLFRIGILAFAAFGATWAAERLMLSVAPDAEPVVVAQAEQASPTPAAQPDAAEPGENGGASAQIEALSSEEIDKELERIEAAVAGADVDELEEFTPTKPLAADLAIALPSDI